VLFLECKPISGARDPTNAHHFNGLDLIEHTDQRRANTTDQKGFAKLSKAPHDVMNNKDLDTVTPKLRRTTFGDHFDYVGIAQFQSHDRLAL
jgi:hypothetical protein